MYRADAKSCQSTATMHVKKRRDGHIYISHGSVCRPCVICIMVKDQNEGKGGKQKVQLIIGCPRAPMVSLWTTATTIRFPKPR